ncbi:hypothetical protein HYW87_03895, partial [Candidatus Roizmanbacteria bacterium]|nr:hypothetical protein [Candidatus Roizmanbacteria bacterium]
NLNVPLGFSGKAEISDLRSTDFVTPLLQSSGQYTLYLSQPGPGAPNTLDFNNLESQYNSQRLTFCSTSNSVALELTFMKNTVPATVRRYVINPPGSPLVQGTGMRTASPGGASCPSSTLAGEDFDYNYTLSVADVGSNNVLLFIRLIGSGSGAKIGVKGVPNLPLPLQGRTITSDAKSDNTGVTKKVLLFQSYPQIPAEFFVTRF